MKVIVYSTPSCQWCKKTKNLLKEEGVDFEDIDVSQSEKNSKEMIEKSGQMGVPVIVIDKKVIIGFKEEEIKKALGK